MLLQPPGTVAGRYRGADRAHYNASEGRLTLTNLSDDRVKGTFDFTVLSRTSPRDTLAIERTFTAEK
jgi:hypothetical protein